MKNGQRICKDCLPLSREKIGVSTREGNTQQQKCDMYIRLCPTVTCTVLVWYMFRNGSGLSNTVEY